MSKRSMHTKAMHEERIELKRKLATRGSSETMITETPSWIVAKRKRSGRSRPANVIQNCIGGTHMLNADANKKDSKIVQNVTGIRNRVELDSSTLFKKQKRQPTKGHIEKFLTGNSNPKPGVMTRRMKSNPSEGRAPRNVNFSRSTDEKTNVNPSAGKFPGNGGPLFKRLLSAFIDENNYLDHLRHKECYPSIMQEREMDLLCGSVPDEKLLLKELHLIGIHPEKLPGLLDKEDVANHDNEDPHVISSIELSDEPPVLALRSSRSVNYGFPGAAGTRNDVFHQRKAAMTSIKENNRKNGQPISESGTEGQKVNALLRDKSEEPASTSCHGIKSQEVTQSVLKSPLRSTDQLTIGGKTDESLDNKGLDNSPDDLSLLLDLDDVLLQDGDENFVFLDIPMDDLSTLEFFL